MFLFVCEISPVREHVAIQTNFDEIEGPSLMPDFDHIQFDRLLWVGASWMMRLLTVKIGFMFIIICAN